MAEDKKKSFAARLGGVTHRIGKFFKDVKGEIKKIVWPTVPTVFKNTGITLLAIVVIGLFVFALDFGLNKLFGLIMELS
jgi:preprotein translocase subunit SecE